MALTPVEIRHIQLKRGLFGYRKASVHRMMDDIADSFETVWRERSQLVERVEELETEVARHVELEGLLRSTLVSAERASQDLKEAARREAGVIVSEANAEARKVMRDAITEKEQLMGDVRRVQALLRSALAVVDETPARHDCRRARLGARRLDDGRVGAARRLRRRAAVALRRRPTETETDGGDAEARRVDSDASILGAWSPARSASTSGSRRVPGARPSSDATATPGSCASQPRPSAAARTTRSSTCSRSRSTLRRPDVRIVGGAVSRDKVVEIAGLTLEEAERRLASAQKGSS